MKIRCVENVGNRGYYFILEKINNIEVDVICTLIKHPFSQLMEALPKPLFGNFVSPICSKVCIM